MVSISIKVSLPKDGVFTNKKWLEDIARTQRQSSVPRLRKLFQKTVFGWSRKPDFGWAQTRNADELGIIMYPTGPNADIWELVNAGSPSHIITQKHGGFLRFRPGYRSATMPGSIQSRRAYRSGKFIGSRIVHHPGFEAREFDRLIAEEYNNPFMNEMQAAFDRVAKNNS